MIILCHEETMLRSFWRQDVCAPISFVYFRVMYCSCVHIVSQVVIYRLSNHPITEWNACNPSILLHVFCSFVGLVFQIWSVIGYGSHSMLLQLLLTRPCMSPLRSYPKSSQGSIWIYVCFLVSYLVCVCNYYYECILEACLTQELAMMNLFSSRNS